MHKIRSQSRKTWITSILLNLSFIDCVYLYVSNPEFCMVSGDVDLYGMWGRGFVWYVGTGFCMICHVTSPLHWTKWYRPNTRVVYDSVPPSLLNENGIVQTWGWRVVHDTINSLNEMVSSKHEGGTWLHHLTEQNAIVWTRGWHMIPSLHWKK